MATQLNEISGTIQEKERMANQLLKERESMETLKTHFTDAMKSLQDEVELLNSERAQLLDKINDKNAATKAQQINGASSASQAKMKSRLEELQARIRVLRAKSADHSKSLRLREQAERRCEQLQNEIADDKRKRAALQRKMKEEAEGRRNEKKAAEIKAMKMLREGEKLKLELNKVREAAAKQANVLKRKAAEALAKQRIQAEQRKRHSKNSGTVSGGSQHSAGTSIDKTRKSDLTSWMSREVENMAMVSSTKDQLNEQATLRAAAAKKREAIIDKRGMAGVSQQVKMLDVEVDTRTGVICQLQRSLMELEKEAKANTLETSQISGVIGLGGSGERFHSITKLECKFLLSHLLEKLIASKLEVEKLKNAKGKADNEAIDAAIEAERVKARNIVKNLKLEHSEALMTLMEGTKSVVERKIGLSVKEAEQNDGDGWGVIDDDLKATVDEMLGDFMSGFQKVSLQMQFTTFSLLSVSLSLSL